MDFFYLLLNSAIALVILCVLFIPMERVFPAKKGQKIFRKKWLLDLSFFLGQYLLWHGLVLAALNIFEDSLSISNFQESIRSQPFYLQAIEVIILSDVLIYWAHRLQHKIPFLWRFHKVHHSAEHLDWLAAHREHPLDTIYTVGLINLPSILFGFPIESIAVLIVFRGIWAVYIHSNVRLPIKGLRVLIGAPELHHWHHDKNRDAGNYANVSPIMDVIFGTYVCPDHEPQAFGIEEESPKSYVGQLIEPVLPKSIWKKITAKNED